MTNSRFTLLRREWSAQLAANVRRTPSDSPDGARWLRRWALVCLIVTATLYLACGYHAGFLRINAWAAAYPDWIWQCLTALGDERLPFALALFFSLRYPRLLWALVLAALIAVLYSRGLKELFESVRPPGALAADVFHLIGPGHHSNSFPSGHSVVAAAFYGVLIYHARQVTWRTLFLVIAILVGLSRVAVGIHWPVDVAAGLFGGALAALLGAWLAARWPAPATRLSMHIPVVALACVLAVSLLFNDGGYPAAALMLRILAVAALLSAIGHYVVGPWWRNQQRV